MNKRNKLIIGAIAGVVVVTTGVIAMNLGGNTKNYVEKEIVVNEDLVIDKPVLVVEEMREAVESGDIELGESIIDSNIVSATMDQADEMVYYFAKEAETYGNMLINNHPEFINYLSEKKVKVEDLEKFIARKDTPDFVKNVWTDMQYYMVELTSAEAEEYIHERYMTRFIPNYNAILEKYRPFISERMQDLLKMRSNVTWNYSKTNNGGFIPEIVERNILSLHEYLEKYSDGPYLRDARNDYEFLMQLYFSYLPGARLFNEYDLTILSEGVGMYEKTAKRDDFLGEKARVMIEGLSQSNNKMTPELLHVIEDITEINGDNYIDYWNNILRVPVRFDGPGRYGSTVTQDEYIIDPETQEIIDVERHN